MKLTLPGTSNRHLTRGLRALFSGILFQIPSILLWIFVTESWLLSGSCQEAVPRAAAEIGREIPQVRPRPTQELLPTVSWDAEWQITRTRPGYPLLKQVEHFQIHEPNPDSGAYHHHPQIIIHAGRFYVSWSNHPSGEDGPGQKVVGAVSVDGKNWTSIGNLFDAVDDINVSTANGRLLMAAPFVQLDGRLFAVAIVNDGVGFGTMQTPVDGEPLSKVKTSELGKRIRRGWGTLVREIKPDDSLGKTFWIGKTKPSPIPGFPKFQTAEELHDESLSAEFVTRLASQLRDPVGLLAREAYSVTTEVVADDGSRLCEPTTCATNNGMMVRYLRDLSGSQRLFVQFSFDGGKSWTAGQPTPIPDAPSKSCAGRLSDGTIFLVGNQVVSKRGTRRDPLTIGLSTDGVTFQKAFAIRWRTPKFRVPSQQAEPDGRGLGFQYPSVAIGKDALWVVYSVNKEAIDVSRIPLSELLEEE